MFLLKYKGLILAVFIATVLISMACVRYLGLPFEYNYESLCVISPLDTIRESPFNKDVKVGFEDKSFIGPYEVSTMLESRGLNYFITQEYNLLPRLFNREWNELNHKWLISPPPSLEDAHVLLKKILKIKWDESSKTFILMCFHHDQDMAQKILGYYIDGLSTFLRERTIEIIDLQIASLRLQLATENDSMVKEILVSQITAQLEKRNLAKTLKYYGFRLVKQPTLVNIEPENRRVILKYWLFPITTGILASLIVALAVMLFDSSSSISKYTEVVNLIKNISAHFTKRAA